MKIQNKTGILGVVPCVVFGVMSVAAQWDSPTYLSDSSLPAGVAARTMAGLFVDKPGPAFAGSEYMALAGKLYLAGVLLCLGSFAAAFWLYTHPRRAPAARAFDVLLVVQLAAALAGGLDFLYFLVLEVAIVLPLRPALKWLALVMLCSVLVRLPFIGIGGSYAYTDAMRAVYRGATMLTMLVIGFGIGLLVASERRGRLRVAAAHAELLATQQLLADAVRASERLRIARDLHDAIGHHLTALNLQLELAVRQQPEADAPVVAARGLAQSLLSAVRTVVGMEREGQLIDVQQALRTLCAGIPRPCIALDFDAAAMVRSPAIAQALFYGVQEAVTNAVRHARANCIRIVIAHGGDQVIATVSDDGLGRRGAADGNGLRGMRERIDTVGGSVVVNDVSAGGTTVRLAVPCGARS